MRHIFAVAAAAGALLTGCAVAGTPVAAPVTDEWRTAVIESMGGLGAAQGPVGDAMGTAAAPTDFPTLHTACEDLRSYLDTMQRDVLPGPDMNVNSALQDGIDGYRSVADQCTALTPRTTSAELLKLNTTIDGADKRLKDGLKLLGIDIPKP
ncbi:hypothetical protein [Mycolicibacterium sp. XJ870]